MNFTSLAILSGATHRQNASALAEASKTCARGMKSGEIYSFTHCVKDQLTTKGSRQHKEKHMNIGTASRLCKGLGKQKRKACMRAKLGGSKRRHHKKRR